MAPRPTAGPHKWREFRRRTSVRVSVRFGEASTQGFGRIDVNRSYRVCDKGGASERFRLNGSFARSAAKRDEALPGGSLRTPTICAFCRLVLR
jgi:hypothetical protein